MAIVLKDISKCAGSPPTQILADVALTIREGEFVALTGRSGSGKSSLLYIMSSLDFPTRGSVEIDGHDIAKMKGKELARFRNQRMGFIFQFHYLISEFTAIENVLLPARKLGQEKQRRSYAEELLARVGLGSKFNRLPRQLSGGEQQRVAIARSLILDPLYLFADEPTGALDSVNGEIVMNMLRATHQEKKTTVLLVTHDAGFASAAPRKISLADGRLVSDSG